MNLHGEKAADAARPDASENAGGGLGATPCSLSDFMRVIHEAPIEWVAVNIHPHVVRIAKDTDASYLRRMALWAMATNTFPANAKHIRDDG